MPDTTLPVHGAMGHRFVEIDWSQTPLGPAEEWPESLRMAVHLCLSSRFPILIWWGPELVMVYNDAYRPMLGTSKHPHAFGASGRTVFPEIWDTIGPMLDDVMAGLGATWSSDQQLLLDRNGYLEECYFTFSYSPIPVESGAVGGVFTAVTETTTRVLSERRLATLAEMSTRLGDAVDEPGVRTIAEASLNENRLDHPLVMIVDVRDLEEQLVHIPSDLRAEASIIVKAAAESGAAQYVDVSSGSSAETEAATAGLGAAVGGLHARPISLRGDTTSAFVLLTGHSVHRRWDRGLETYLALCATYIANALSGIRERETQRQRAEGLAALDEAKSVFFTNVSHELRTPLTLISGPVREALADQGLDEQLHRRLEIINRNVVRLTRMVDALLDFDRMDVGRVTPRRVSTNISRATRNLAVSFAAAMERGGLDFEVDIAEVDETVYVDRDMYERIVLNLLTNALKYTPTGRVRLRLRSDAKGIEVVVEDTGVGIPAADLDRVFERFEQLPRRRGSRSREGAGIGLAMVKQLTELLGGTVHVTSRVNKGSRFTVRLPWGEPDLEPSSSDSITPRHIDAFLTETEGWDLPYAAEPAAHEPLGDAVAGLSPAISGVPRLLVAEDNADMRAYLSDVLSDEFAVEVASDGRKALASARAHRPDIVLADVMMPGLDGFELSRAIRNDGTLADLPIVLISARAGDRNTAAGLGAGADDYLVKPFSVPELRARLASNLERSGSRLRDAAWRRAVMTSFQDPLVISDESGRVVELNQAFTEVLGWSMADGPFQQPYPWWPAGRAKGSGPTEGHVSKVVTGSETPGANLEEVRLVAKDGRDVWVKAVRQEVGAHGSQPGLTIETLTDVTREHDSRERRRAAAELSTEFGSAADLTQVLTAAVSGFAELFDGEPTVRAIAGAVEHVFTAAGPMLSTELEPAVLASLNAVDAEPPAANEIVSGILLTPEQPGSDCRVWVEFRHPRTVSTDERIVGDLLAQAFALAVDRVVQVTDFADRESHLAKAIESHRMIGQAIGILIERHRVTSAEAFAMLKQASQDRNIKLREIAARVIETGAEPGDAE